MDAVDVPSWLLREGLWRIIPQSSTYSKTNCIADSPVDEQ